MFSIKTIFWINFGASYNEVATGCKGKTFKQEM